MALDSVLFNASIPAGTYAVGDTIPLAVNRGAAVVRDGYGAAILKKIFTASAGLANAEFKLVIKNSNWIDELSNPIIPISDTALDENSVSINRGHDCNLMPNSSWQVYAVCYVAGTTTAAAEIFALLDIDYPSVPSVSNPRLAQGTPVTIDNVTMTITAPMPGNTLVWYTTNVDVFKAGYKYLLTQASFELAQLSIGFLAISGAAGQNGLERIVPVRPGQAAGIRYLIDYATPLVKGPMNVSFMGVSGGGAAITGQPYCYMDYVRK